MKSGHTYIVVHPGLTKHWDTLIYSSGLITTTLLTNLRYSVSLGNANTHRESIGKFSRKGSNFTEVKILLFRYYISMECLQTISLTQMFYFTCSWCSWWRWGAASGCSPRPGTPSPSWRCWKWEPSCSQMPTSPRAPRHRLWPYNNNSYKFALLWGEAQLCLPYVCW